MILVHNFTKRYGDHEAVKNISFTAKDGAITGFIGHNGAGKSTTIKAITGVIRPTEGSISINGIDIVKDAQKAKYQFGYVSDSPDHFLRLSGIEYLNFMAAIAFAPLLAEPAVQRIVWIVSAAVVLVILVLTPMINHFSVRKACENLMKLACVSSLCPLS